MTAGKQDIDLKEVARLVAALQRDLAKVSRGGGDIQRLKDEAESLGKLLETAAPGHGQVKDALHRLHSVLEHGMQAVVGEAVRDWPYVAEIGRMLGMR